VVFGAGAVVALVAGGAVEPVPPVPPVEPVEPVLPVLPFGTVTPGGWVGTLEPPESAGLIRKMISAVSRTTPTAPPMALTSSARGRPGFQLELDCREGFRRFVTSS
jgi:hypothetical protein